MLSQLQGSAKISVSLKRSFFLGMELNLVSMTGHYQKHPDSSKLPNQFRGKTEASGACGTPFEAYA